MSFKIVSLITELSSWRRISDSRVIRFDDIHKVINLHTKQIEIGNSSNFLEWINRFRCVIALYSRQRRTNEWYIQYTVCITLYISKRWFNILRYIFYCSPVVTFTRQFPVNSNRSLCVCVCVFCALSVKHIFKSSIGKLSGQQLVPFFLLPFFCDFDRILSIKIKRMAHQMFKARHCVRGNERFCDLNSRNNSFTT